MRLVEQILMPVDIHSEYHYQLEMVAFIAKAFNSVVIPVYILPVDAQLDSIKDLIREMVDAKLSLITDSLTSQGVAVLKSIVDYGTPYDRIIKLAMDHDVNLIVVGSAGFTTQASYKLGSTAENLIRKSEKPIWIVKPSSEVKISRILCPVDFSEPSVRAFRNAIQLSKRFNASLTVLSVYEPLANSSFRFGKLSEKENKKHFQEQREKLDDFLEEYDLSEVNVIAKVKQGVAHEEILHEIQLVGHDLLIMGTTGRTGLSRVFMGSVTERVTREFPCSVITTKSTNIVNLQVISEIMKIEEYFRLANDLFEKKMYQDALVHYLNCIQINSMYIPSYFKIAQLYRILGEEEKGKYYEDIALDLLLRIWGEDLSKEVRKYYRI